MQILLDFAVVVCGKWHMGGRKTAALSESLLSRVICRTETLVAMIIY